MEQLPLKNTQSNPTGNSDKKTRISQLRDELQVLINDILIVKNVIDKLNNENDELWQGLRKERPNNQYMTKIVDNHYETAKLIFQIELLANKLSKTVHSFNKLITEGNSFFRKVNFNCNDIFEMLEKIKAIFAIDLNNFMRKLNAIANIHEDKKLTQTLMKEYISLSLPTYIALDRDKQIFFSYWFYGKSSETPTEKLKGSLELFSQDKMEKQNLPTPLLNY